MVPYHAKQKPRKKDIALNFNAFTVLYIIFVHSVSFPHQLSAGMCYFANPIR
jgi:hypothetical protein